MKPEKLILVGIVGAVAFYAWKVAAAKGVITSKKLSESYGLPRGVSVPLALTEESF